MRKPKTKPPKVEDEAQSQRFLDLAHELEAAGELSPTEDGEAFNALMRALSRVTRRHAEVAAAGIQIEYHVMNLPGPVLPR